MDTTPATRPFVAAACIIAAMALIGLVDNLVVIVARELGLWQFHLIRAVLALPLILIVAALARRRVRPGRIGAVALRSVLLAISMVFYFGSLAWLPVAEVAAGLFTAPIFVLLFSFAGVGRRVGGLNIVAVAVGFAGVLMVLRPDVGAASGTTLMPLAAGLFYALAAITTRSLCRQEGTYALLAGFFIAMLLMAAAGSVALILAPQPVPDGVEGFLLRGWQPVSARMAGLLAFLALGAVAGVGLVIRGYLLAEAAFVAVFEYSLLIFAALWGWLLWGQVLSAAAVGGIALIILSGAILARTGKDCPPGT